MSMRRSAVYAAITEHNMMVADLEEAQAAIQRVRELHGRHDPNCPYGEDCAGAGLCLACREEYPCATIRALDGLEGRIDD